MATIYTDERGDEISAADFDDYVSPAYKAKLRRHPDPRDPECPLHEADLYDEHQEVETPDINDEPIPYTNNKEAS